VLPKRFELLFLQDTQQFGLQGRRNIADFIQEQRAFVGQLERPIFCAMAPVNAPRSWPKARFPVDRTE